MISSGGFTIYMFKKLILTAGVGILLFNGQTASASNLTPNDLVNTKQSIRTATKQKHEVKQSIQAIKTKLKQLDRQEKAIQTKINGTSEQLESFDEQLKPEETSLFAKVVSSVFPSAKAEAAEAEEERNELMKKKEEASKALNELEDKQQSIAKKREKYKTAYTQKNKQYKKQSNYLSELKKQYQSMVPDRFLMPATGRLSQGFGAAGGENGYTFHNGLDIAAKTGTPIYAAADGKVTQVSSSGPYGKHMKIEHTIDGQKWTTVYAHMNRIDVKKGQTVLQGEQIGQIGTTGNSTGPHLHFEVHKGNYSFSATSAGHAINPMKVAERVGGASPVKQTL